MEKSPNEIPSIILMSDGLIGAANILIATSCSPIVGKSTCSKLSNKNNYVLT